MYKIYLYPFFTFLFIWFGFFVFRHLPIIYWPELDGKTIFFLLGALFSIILFYFSTSFYYSNKIKVLSNENINIRSLNKNYNFLVFLSLISLFLIALNVILQLKFYGLGFSLNGLTQLRYMKIEENLFKGSLLYQFSLIFGAFPLVLYLFSMYYQSFISKRKEQISLMVLLLFLVLNFSGGGRNPLFLSLIILVLAFLFKNKIKLKRKIFKLKYIIISSVVFVSSIFVFAKIFFDREELRGRTIEDGIDNILTGYDLQLYDFFQKCLSIDILKEISYTFFMLYFYAVHSLNELNDFIINSYSNQDLYFGAISFYPIVQFLNKFGLDLPTITMIKSEINDTGTYKTLLGELYFDFGIFGTFIVLGILTIIFVKAFSNFYFKNSFLGFCISTIISMIFVTSPIYNTFSTGMIFLPFLISMYILFIFMKFNRI
ncbi:O-antigen polymerase [Arcobacter cloacae]|uniref:Oligosaccharide repeat unit polymerase n=1 Tax=Arcobacter cloacae TaxID=1054034 RepID=A0A4Q0ZA57_9BACT|nr:O-antigen polymerase [Arcobacter cloacae]RXJ83093.1 hypothetical protein CRU90_11110 [Arcobacter cloacae]